MDSCSFGGTTNPAAQKIPECKLSHDMGCLLEQGVLTDVVLSVYPHQEVAAHKAILAGETIKILHKSHLVFLSPSACQVFH